MALSTEEVRWFRRLGNLGNALRQKLTGGIIRPLEKALVPRPWDAPNEMRQWRTFELADAMEQGLSRELTTHFVEPIKGSEQVRYLVQRSEDQREFLLKTEKDDPLLLAKLNLESRSGARFDIYVAGGGDPPVALGPAFDVQANPRGDQWTLRSLRCEHCEFRGTRASGPRSLANVSHYREEVGAGTAWCMDVLLPKINDDGSSAVWCQVCGCAGQQEEERTELTMRRPKWNSTVKALMLDFYGRCSLASAKNIQLKVAGDSVGIEGGTSDKVKLLFGKTKSNSFVLDFRRPLGTVQAFAIALTTYDWH